MNMNRDEALCVINDFLATAIRENQWFINIEPFIKAIIFFGSRSKETNRPDSDIDILIIVPLKKEEQYTDGEYLHTFKGIEINIVLRSIERLRKIAKEKTDEFQKEIFRKSVIISDSDGEVTNLLKEIDTI